ncbi:hypothetical protein D3C76_1396360 [compost metagenome]
MEEATLWVFSIGYIKRVQQIKTFHVAMNECVDFFRIGYFRKADDLHVLIAENQYNPIIDLYVLI